MRHSFCAAAALTLLAATPSSIVFADARGDAKAQVTFGINVAQEGLWREAKYRFERAVAIDPMYAAAWNNLAIACEQLGHIDKAKQAYEKAVALPRTMISSVTTTSSSSKSMPEPDAAGTG